ncbi:hypothetical protein TKK_0001960 [Trichogramma kaykai]
MSLIRKLIFAYLFLYLTNTLTAIPCDLSYLKCGNVPLEVKLCGKEDIPKQVDYTALKYIGSKNNTEAGVVRVGFKIPPKVGCIYKVVLMVNPHINTTLQCDSYEFNKKKISETFSRELMICPQKETMMTELDFPYGQSCNSSRQLGYKLDLLFNNVFTACYGLGFITDLREMIIPTQTVIRTDYEKIDIGEIKSSCEFTPNKFESDKTKDSMSALFSINVSQVPRNVKGIYIGVSNEKSNTHVIHIQQSRRPHRETEYVNIDFHNNYGYCEGHVSDDDPSTLGRISCHYRDFEFQPSRNYKMLVHLEDDRCSDGLLWNAAKQEGMNKRCIFETKCTLNEKLFVDETIVDILDGRVSWGKYLTLKFQWCFDRLDIAMGLVICYLIFHLSTAIDHEDD